MFNALVNAIKTQWNKQHISAYVQQIKNGEIPEAFIYNFLIHKTGDRLESGKLHIYRGVLDPEGRIYKALFDHSIDTMVKLGVYTDDWAQENLRNPVYSAISSAG